MIGANSGQVIGLRTNRTTFWQAPEMIHVFVWLCSGSNTLCWPLKAVENDNVTSTVRSKTKMSRGNISKILSSRASSIYTLLPGTHVSEEFTELFATTFLNYNIRARQYSRAQTKDDDTSTNRKSQPVHINS